jgi:hypothetical protein
MLQDILFQTPKQIKIENTHQDNTQEKNKYYSQFIHILKI